MTYTVIEPIKVRTRQGVTELKTGQNVKLTAGVAEDLLRRGKIKLERAEGGIPYIIFYSGFLKDCFLFTKTDKDAQALRDSGILDVVYSHREVKELEGLPPVSIKAHHMIKKAFLKSTVEKGINQ